MVFWVINCRSDHRPSAAARPLIADSKAVKRARPRRARRRHPRRLGGDDSVDPRSIRQPNFAPGWACRRLMPVLQAPFCQIRLVRP
jgi:hypothetical protein